MVNKKGFIRTLEAVIAIVIILGFIIYIAPSRKLDIGIPSNVKEAKEFVLHEVLTDEELRECVVSGNLDCKDSCGGKLKKFLDDNKPAGYEYECEICPWAGSSGCGEHREVQEMEKDVYSGAVLLSYSENKYIEFRMFFYEK